MKKPKILLACLSSVICFAAQPAMAEPTWPARPVKLVVPYPAGGNTDNIARMAAEWLTGSLGQTVIVENKGGAGGAIGAQAVARSTADGYTLLLAPSGVMTITPHLRSTPYQVADFVPVASVASSYGLVSARKDLPANNMAQLAALAKREPGKLSYGSAGIATATHLAGEFTHHSLGIQLLHAPYKGSGGSLNGLSGGQVDVLYDPIALPQVRAGRVKALAVTGKNRHPELPEVPTLMEQGLAYMGGSWFGVLAPKGTPPAIVDQIATALDKALKAPGVEKQLATMSLYPDFKGAAALAKAMQDDSASYKEFITRSGIKAE
jgi:tripartite-type tricarboxylate transporter receptor subunit TctC